MANYSYNDGVPATNDNPTDDQPQMLINTQSIKSIIGEDHNTFGINNGGYHTIIHQDNPVATPRTRSGVGAVTANFPTPISGINQVFQALYTPDSTGATEDTQLFNLTGGGGVSQLTGSFTPPANASEGWQWIGGVLVQWGRVIIQTASGKDSGTVTFKDRVVGAIGFPNFCYTVLITPVSKGTLPSSQISISIRRDPTNASTTLLMDKDSFSWFSYTNSSDYRGFLWIAIGS